MPKGREDVAFTMADAPPGRRLRIRTVPDGDCLVEEVAVGRSWRSASSAADREKIYKAAFLSERSKRLGLEEVLSKTDSHEYYVWSSKN